MNSTLGKPIGLGRTSEIYEYTDETVLKLFKTHGYESMARHESKIYSAVKDCGLPIPRLFDEVTVNGRKGLVYQKINGISISRAIQENPRKLMFFARDMAALHNDIGSCAIKSDIDTYKSKLAWGINRQNLLSKEENNKILSCLEGMDEKSLLCHGDLHPENILLENGRYWVIDWITAGKGSFAADAMRTHMILTYGSSPNDAGARFVLSAATALIKKAYFNKLIKISGLDKGEIFAWELPVLAARLPEGNPKHEEDAIIKRIRKLLN